MTIIATRAAKVALLATLFTVPLEDVVAVPSVGTLTRVVGLLAAGLGVLAVVLNGTIRRPRASHLLLSLLVLWALLSYFWTVDHTLTTERSATWVQLLVLTLLIWQFGRARRDIDQFLYAVLLGSLLVAGLTVQRYWAGDDVFNDATRVAAGTYDVNDLGLTLAIGLGCALLILSDAKNRGRRRLIVASCVLLIFAIVLTASRGAAVASAVGILTFLARPIGRARRLTMVGVIAIPITWLSLAILPDRNVERLATIGTELGSGSFNGRLQLWGAAISTIRSDGIIGIGANAFPRIAEERVGIGFVAHNTFLSIWAELGLVAVALLLGVCLDLLRGWRRTPSTRRWGWLVVLAVWAVGASTLSWEIRKLTWVLVGLLLADIYSQRRERRDRVSDSLEAV